MVCKKKEAEMPAEQVGGMATMANPAEEVHKYWDKRKQSIGADMWETTFADKQMYNGARSMKDQSKVRKISTRLGIFHYMKKS
jgi:hypothetical protein